MLGSHHENSRKTAELTPKDRRFSYSSVFSRPSLELVRAEPGRQIQLEKHKSKPSKS